VLTPECVIQVSDRRLVMQVSGTGKAAFEDDVVPMTNRVRRTAPKRHAAARPCRKRIRLRDAPSEAT
jgi:hypothetical protein